MMAATAARPAAAYEPALATAAPVQVATGEYAPQAAEEVVEAGATGVVAQVGAAQVGEAGATGVVAALVQTPQVAVLVAVVVAMTGV